MGNNDMVVVDYKMGNIGSVLNMLKKIGAEAISSSRKSDIDRADKLVLPGIGSFDAGMKRLSQMNLVDVLNRKVQRDEVPILGICLGMQLMTERSEEGTVPGLCWIEAETVQFKFTESQIGLKIPHMGWNLVKMLKQDSLYKGFHEEPRFYFAHSYHVVCSESEEVLSRTTYGKEFVSSFRKSNIFGVQFHPEKSHKFGMTLLRNFVEL
jgi:glutamine amidotransferase